MSLKSFLWGSHKAKDPSQAAMPYTEKALASQEPYVQAGNNARNLINPQYADMAQNTNDYYNNIAKNYKQSEGFAAKRDELLRQAGNTAAAGGFAGGEQHQKGATGLVDALMADDFQQWYNNYMGIQGAGLSGQQHTADQGFEASNNQANQYNNQAGLAYQSQEWKNRQNQDKMNNFIKLITTGGGAIAGGLAGGPAGAVKGAQIGGQFF